VSDSRRQFGLRVISGEARGVGPTLLRAGLAALSPVYSTLMRLRNWKYDRGWGVKRLPRPVVSVGNITTGGTGKTPVVRWLYEKLREAGMTPAILMRGYGARPGEMGDEEKMLRSLLPDPIVRADPDRYAGGLAVLHEHPNVDVFVLDDGFQHRRLARDFDLVLIDATDPFGYGRVLPRGLLREPRSGLARADAVLITRADQGAIELAVDVPAFRCVHEPTVVRMADGSTRPLESLAGRRVFAFAGIGNPAAFERQLRSIPLILAGMRVFDDHHVYTPEDVYALFYKAKDSELILTTEKDFVKVQSLLWTDVPPIARLDVRIRFLDDAEDRLFTLIRDRIQSRRQ
jgi:tetraacyldisaccharide 4'-kinase